MPLPAFLARFLPRPQPQQLNRAVLLVIPREPFIEWAARVTGYPLSEMRETLKRDRTAYLIPMSDDIKVEPEVVKAYWPTLFEDALYDWDADKKHWPQKRTQALFRQWFDLEQCGLVLDMVTTPLAREPWEEPE